MVQSPAPRERRILDAAKKLFFERGFTATGMVAIGAEAGMSGPAIYNHFESKDEILVTLCFEAADRLTAQVGLSSDDPAADLAALARNHVRSLLRDRRLATVYVTESKSLPPAYARLLDRRLEQYAAHWVSTLERCWPTDDRDRLSSVAYATMGLGNSVVLWPDDAFDAPALEELIVAMSLSAAAVLDRSVAHAQI